MTLLRLHKAYARSDEKTGNRCGIGLAVDKEIGFTGIDDEREDRIRDAGHEPVPSTTVADDEFGSYVHFSYLHLWEAHHMRSVFRLSERT